jgi:hypothetical protein
MSSIWSYDFCVYGDDYRKIKKFEERLPDLTYENQLDEQVPVFHGVEFEYDAGAFLVVHAYRNYGGDIPLLILAETFPDLLFAGTFDHEQGFIEAHYIWESRNGKLDVTEHRHEDPDYEGREITADELRAMLKRVTHKLERLTHRLVDDTFQLLHWHRDSLTGEEALAVEGQAAGYVRALPENKFLGMDNKAALMKRLEAAKQPPSPADLARLQKRIAERGAQHKAEPTKQRKKPLSDLENQIKETLSRLGGSQEAPSDVDALPPAA